MEPVIINQRHRPICRIILLLAGLLIPAWAQALNFKDSRHLLIRTGFAVKPAEIRVLRPLSYESAVRRLLSRTHTRHSLPAPSWVNDPLPDFRRIRTMSPEQKKALRMRFRRQARELKNWWYREMIQTDSPLTERMTLFWHNHFTSSFRKVRLPVLLYRQNVLLRQHALGNFGKLLHAIARDPAMILYLDNQSNHKQKPNENFAREVLELFTVGEGHYSEKDIKEAARAFTGWMVDRRTGEFRFNPRRHDFNDKTFMGQTGNFNGDDIIEIILRHPRTAIFITEKLWREFVSDKPDQKEIHRIAKRFRDSGYDIKTVLFALFTSSAFRDRNNHGTLVKSPVELIVGTIRQFDLPVNEHHRLALAGRYLGQDLLDPPSVKGWPGGTSWITSSTLLARQHLLRRLIGAGDKTMGDRRMRRRGMPAGYRVHITAMGGSDGDGLANRLARLLLPIPPVNPLPAGMDTITLIRHLVLDPAYQLK